MLQNIEWNTAEVQYLASDQTRKAKVLSNWVNIIKIELVTNKLLINYVNSGDSSSSWTDKEPFTIVRVQRTNGCLLRID